MPTKSHLSAMPTKSHLSGRRSSRGVERRCWWPGAKQTQTLLLLPQLLRETHLLLLMAGYLLPDEHCLMLLCNTLQLLSSGAETECKSGGGRGSEQLRFGES